MKPSRFVNIQQKLSEIDIDPKSISLGEFTFVGEHTARRQRDPGSELWKTVGSHFTPNLERGILIYSLIKKFNLKSYLECGLGRGYSSLCAARAFAELGNDGRVMSIEPNLDQRHMEMLGKVFPSEWTNRINVAQGASADILPKLSERYDLVYVDGNHTFDAVKSDWNGVRELYGSFCLFDDYHVAGSDDQNIKVKEALDECELPEGVTCELIRMDRRMVPDDRGWPDEKIQYGQLLLTRQSGLDALEKQTKFKETWDWE